MIYLKTNMTEMPKSCQECKLEFYGCCFIKGNNILGVKHRPKWCPLVEVKDNGNEK